MDRHYTALTKHDYGSLPRDAQNMDYKACISKPLAAHAGGLGSLVFGLIFCESPPRFGQMSESEFLDWAYKVSNTDEPGTAVHLRHRHHIHRIFFILNRFCMICSCRNNLRVSFLMELPGRAHDL
jgi:hypothetical protein